MDGLRCATYFARVGSKSGRVCDFLRELFFVSFGFSSTSAVQTSRVCGRKSTLRTLSARGCSKLHDCAVRTQTLARAMCGQKKEHFDNCERGKVHKQQRLLLIVDHKHTIIRFPCHKLNPLYFVSGIYFCWPKCNFQGLEESLLIFVDGLCVHTELSCRSMSIFSETQRLKSVLFLNCYRTNNKKSRFLLFWLNTVDWINLLGLECLINTSSAKVEH